MDTPIKAIRKHCLECVGNHRSEVVLCTSPKCKLFPYRFGKRPSTLKAKGIPFSRVIMENEGISYEQLMQESDET